MAYYKKTPNIEESKTPPALHFSKCQGYLQGSKKYPRIPDTTEIEE